MTVCVSVSHQDQTERLQAHTAHLGAAQHCQQPTRLETGGLILQTCDMHAIEVQAALSVPDAAVSS